MAHIWRIQAFGIAYESTAWTKEAATAWIPKTSGIIKPMIETMKDTSWYGVIDELNESDTVKEFTETSIEGIASDRAIWHLLHWAMWASAISWSWPYTHAFTVLNDNSHPTFTLRGKDPVESISSSYNMINEFSIDAQTGEYVKFNAGFIGRKKVSESAPTVAYNSWESLFRARDVKVYLSDTEGSRGTALTIERIKLTINKNLYQQYNLGSVDMTTQHNQQLTVVWDFEALFNDLTFQNFVRNNTNKFMKIEIINTDVALAVSWNPTMTFILGKVVFEARDSTGENNDIVKQTIGFSWAYNNTEGYTVKASLINSVATDYDA